MTIDPPPGPLPNEIGRTRAEALYASYVQFHADRLAHLRESVPESSLCRAAEFVRPEPLDTFARRLSRMSPTTRAAYEQWLAAGYQAALHAVDAGVAKAFDEASRLAPGEPPSGLRELLATDPAAAAVLDWADRYPRGGGSGIGR